jgi:tetratricopeptide (TPR) repeat protein
MSGFLFRRTAAGVMLAALLASAIGLEILRDGRYGEVASLGDVLYVRSPAAMKKLALSFDALVADLYWIRAIQHYGGTKRSNSPDKKYALLYPLLDITTSLDPRFVMAYRFGAIFLAEPYPGGPGRADQAIALLQKGVQATPEKWQYLQDIGFVYYWWLHDYRSAAQWFERASRIKGAPWFLKSLAAVTLTEGGDRKRSRLLWQQLRETNDNDWLRRNAELRLAQLDALDQIDQLRAIIGAFETRTLGRVESWETLVRVGVLRGIPIDPSGTPFVLDPATGRVTVSDRSSLYPLPVEPDAQPPGPPHA